MSGPMRGAAPWRTSATLSADQVSAERERILAKRRTQLAAVPVPEEPDVHPFRVRRDRPRRKPAETPPEAPRPVRAVSEPARTEITPERASQAAPAPIQTRDGNRTWKLTAEAKARLYDWMRAALRADPGAKLQLARAALAEELGLELSYSGFRRHWQVVRQELGIAGPAHRKIGKRGRADALRGPNWRMRRTPLPAGKVRVFLCLEVEPDQADELIAAAQRVVEAA